MDSKENHQQQVLLVPESSYWIILFRGWFSLIKIYSNSRDILFSRTFGLLLIDVSRYALLEV